MREIQAYFDKDPGQCAAVLTGVSPIEIGADHIRLETVWALIDVGLLEVVPGASGGEVRLRPTAMARPHFRERRRAASGEVRAELCYARRKVTRVWLVGENDEISLPIQELDSRNNCGLNSGLRQTEIT